MTKNVLVDVGKLSKPAEILVNRTCDAIGAAVKPWQIKRIAQANADASLIETEADIKKSRMLAQAGVESSEIAQRAVSRLVQEEIQKQENIERVLSLAIDKLSASANPSQIPDDFLTDLFDRCRKTSNADMQKMWADILAQEANRPGTISQATLSIVERFSRRDAENFTKLCSANFHINGPSRNCCNHATKDLIGLNYEDYMELEALGVIRYDGFGRFVITSEADDNQESVHHFSISGKEGDALVTTEKSKKINLSVGHVMLTRAGMELAFVAEAPARPDIFQAFITSLIQPNYWVQQMLTSKFVVHQVAAKSAEKEDQ